MAKCTKYNLEGMMPILPTAIVEDETIDVDSERNLVAHCLQCGANAIGHLAWASEFKKLSEEDRNCLTEVLVEEVAGRVPVFLGVTAPSRRVAIRYALQAEERGVDIIMAALPYACTPKKQEAYDYYKALSESVSIPIIIQDVPVGPTILTADLMWKLYSDFENISYIKAEDHDFLPKTAELLKLSDDGSEIIGGFGGKYMIHMLRLGIKTFMTGTEALDIHNKVVSSYSQGQIETAVDVYYNRLLPYLGFYEQYAEELLKKMLAWRGIIACDKVIPPRDKSSMTEAESREFRWVLDQIDYYNIDTMNNI